MQTEVSRVAKALNQPQGCMVARFWVMDDAGLYFAGNDEFTYEQGNALEFTREDDAEEIAAAYPRTTVERFDRWSRFPDAKADPKDVALSEALSFVQHWRRDRDDNMIPSIDSLNHVESVIRNALSAHAGFSRVERAHEVAGRV